MKRAAHLLLLTGVAAAMPAYAAPANDFSDLGGHKTVEQSLAEMNKRNDPCVYAEPREAAALAGEALVAPPFRVGGDKPDVNGTTCRYMVSGFRSIDVIIAKTGGDKLFEILTGVNMRIDMSVKTPGNLNKTLPLEGEWDEVRAFKGAGLVAIQGDTLVAVETRGLAPATDKVAALVNAIYRHLDKPLAIDGEAGIAQAQAIEQKRPQPRDACSLVARSDIDAIGPLLDGGTSTARECTWRFMVDNQPHTVGVNVLWRGGYSEFAALHTILQGGDKLGKQSAATMNAASAAMMRGVSQITELPPKPWDFAFFSDAGLTAVRSDVLVIAYAPGIAPPKLAALVSHMILRIEAP